MAEVLELLRREHGDMALLLDLMDRQIHRFQDAAELDFAIVRGVIGYFLSFPDLYHHPKEDLVIHKLQARAPEQAVQLEALLNSHQDLAGLTRRFATAAIDQMVRPGEVPRQWFGSLARDFVDTNRRHMAMEEEHFFPIVLRSLSDTEWAELDADVSSETDPLHRGRIEAHFHGLLDAIKQMDGRETSRQTG